MKCDTNICKAACCGFVPIPKETYEEHIDKLNFAADAVDFVEGTVIATTPEGRCGFLDDEYKCSIYEDRPEVCRRYGSGKESHPMLRCKYLGQIGSEEQDKAFDEIMGRIS